MACIRGSHMMSEETLKHEIQLLDQKISIIEKKIAPMIKIEEEAKKYEIREFGRNILTIRVSSKQLDTARINIKRWKMEKEIYLRVLNNKTQNTQMLGN